MASGTWRPAKNLLAGNLVSTRGGKTVIVKAITRDPDDRAKVFMHVQGVAKPYHLLAEKLINVVSTREES